VNFDKSCIGSTINCYLREVDFRRLSAELDMKPLDSIMRKRLQSQEKFLDLTTPDPVPESELENSTSDTRKSSGVQYPRIMKHILFRNATHAEVEKELKDKRVGSVLIRPSSSSSSKLVMEWKMGEDVIAPIEIDEEEKACALFVGRSLRIGEQTFGDFDELYDTYVEPLNETAQSVSHFRYFRRGTKAEIDAMLIESKSKDPKRTPYFVSVSDEHLGHYLLAFMPKNIARHIYFRIVPGKLLLHGNEFGDIEQLISYFKDHSAELLKPPPAPPRRDYDRSSRRDYHSSRHHDDDEYDPLDDGRHHHHSHHHHHHSRHSRSYSRSRSRSYSRSRSRSYSRSRSRSTSREGRVEYRPLQMQPQYNSFIGWNPYQPGFPQQMPPQQ